MDAGLLSVEKYAHSPSESRFNLGHLQLLLRHDAGKVVAEAAQQAAGTLPTQEVETDAPLLAVDLYNVDCPLGESHRALATHAGSPPLLQVHAHKS